MKTFTAKEAKTHFGEFLDAMQREPVMVTKNNRPVGVMLSMDDPRMEFVLPDAEKEPGYDEWFEAKVKARLALAESGKAVFVSHEEVVRRSKERLKAHIEQKAAERNALRAAA
jgi:prevent-host-death family protein